MAKMLGLVKGGEGLAFTPHDLVCVQTRLQFKTPEKV